MEKFVGVWTIKESENFDDYMKAVGVGLALRKLGQVAKPTLTIEVDGNKMKMKSVSAVKTIQLEFNLDEEFDDTTPDGRKTKSKYTMQGDKLVQTQKWDGKETTITRFINGAGELEMSLTMGSVSARRTYTKK